jgi:hypothetical protein
MKCEVKPTFPDLVNDAVGCARLSSPGLATPHESARGDPGSPIPRDGQESLPAAILRCASAREGAASIAFGSQIAIEAAVVAELENSKEK